MSCSEYLGRYKQRMVTYTDTRPRMDASDYTRQIKRQAASGNLETAVVKPVCTTTLNMTATLPNSQFYSGGGHNVTDASVYNEYTAGQAVAQALKPANVKPAQIQNLCLSSSTLPEVNDKMAADPTGFGAIYNAKQTRGKGYNSCLTCGATYKVQFARGCPCSITPAQAALLNIKSLNTTIHTIEPNVNVS
jgi:hypothetical protein